MTKDINNKIDNNEPTAIQTITIYSQESKIKIYKNQTIYKSFEMLIFETLFKIFVDILFLSLLLKYIFNKFKILLNLWLDLYSLLKLSLAVLIFFTLTILIIDLFAQVINFFILFSLNIQIKDEIKINANINKEDESIFKSGYEIFFELILPYIIESFKSFFVKCFKFIDEKIIQNFNENVAKKLINYFKKNKEINSKDIKQKILDKIYDFSTKICHFFEKIYDYIAEKVCLLGSKIKECFIELFKMIKSFILSYILIPCAIKIRDFLTDRYHIDANDVNINNDENTTNEKIHNADAPKFVLQIHEILDLFIKNNAQDNIKEK